MDRISLCFALAAAFSACLVDCKIVPKSSSVEFLGPLDIEAGGVYNIRISYSNPLDGALSMHFGSCERSMLDPREIHHQIGSTRIGAVAHTKRNLEWIDSRPEKFVWLVPASTPDFGCLHAYLDNEVVGVSRPINVKAKRARRGIPIADYVDAEGPWFDGVEYLKAKEPESFFVAKAKGSKIGILGGGMSGLMSAHLLDSVGLTNWKILEASQRIGGRVHTSYLNGTSSKQYQYQEMGPMRFPLRVTDTSSSTTIDIQDHKMVFQLADKLNKQNGANSSYTVNFIPWIQSSKNSPVNTPARRPDGTVPGGAEVAANSSLAATTTYSNATQANELSAAYEDWLGIGNATLMAELGKNIFKVHKQAVDNGIFDFSEFEYLRFKLGASLNISDELAGSGPALDSWFYEDLYFTATEWRTIDQGLSRLPAAFGPQVLNRTTFGITVQELSYDKPTSKVTVGWRPDPFQIVPKTESFDYIITAVPFSKVRMWRLPAFSSLLSRAIGTMNYWQSCKVALHYRTRFWEHLDHPILGGCGRTNIPSIGSICYPSYKLNASGPGVLLASYNSDGTTSRSTAAMTDLDHVALVQRAMIEVHGPIAASEFTGNYDRICWENNQYQSGSWCSPLSGQQDLYLPAYFRTEFNTVFVGEHTSYTHAWIWSALESAVRGTTQLLLEMGLVDEAKAVVEEWMGRWIRV